MSEPSREELEAELKRLRRINAVLKKRVQRSIDSAGTDFSLFEQNIHLERLVTERTTELRTRNEELQLARERAESAAKVKSRFLANMSHELRTPLNVVLGTIQLLSHDTYQFPPEQQQYLRNMSDASEHLLGLINDILDFSRAEDGSLQLQPAALDVSVLLDSTVSGLRHLPTAEGLELALEIAAEVPQAIKADGRRLRQVLVNLIGNACKFTRQGSVRLQVTRDDDVLCFSVTDTGEGIPAESQHNLFDRFTQLEEVDSRQHSGTGLGLAISKQLVQLWGGEIFLESTLGVGTTVRFTHPLHTAQLYATKTPQLSGPACVEGVAPQVLLVDDHPINRLVAQRLLEQLGATVITAASGVEAIEALGSAPQPPDLILMDCQMPGMDGFETTRRIRALPVPWGTLPIVALTASVLDEDREQCLAAGMDAHLTKPVQRETLGQLLTSLKTQVTSA